MAEQVQFNIENSLHELEQMKRVGLFSDNEIRKIIKKRKILEYKVAKMFKRKEDYLKFIQYEIALLNLIRIRREKLRYYHKKSEIDNSIGKRINYLFKAAIKRFPEDLKLWFSHHDFLKKMHWVDSITNMNTQMLQFHNKSPELWVTCAKWEVEDNNSFGNARKLLQRAIRFHPTSIVIRREYFRLELLYVDQLLQRRKVLGVEGIDDSEDNVLMGQVAVVVYKNAMEELKDVKMALSFITVCKEFDFASNVMEIIYSDIEERFPKSEETLSTLAQHCMDQPKKGNTSSKKFFRTCIENAVLKYEHAVKVMPTEKMWDYYIQFLLERVQQSKSETKVLKSLRKVLEVMQEASDLHLLSQKMYVEWIKLLYTTQEFENAHGVALTATSRYPNDPTLWQFCLTLNVKHTDDEEAFLQIFRKAVANISGKQSLPLWEIAIDWATCGKVERLQEIFEEGLRREAEVQVPLKHKYLKITAVCLGIDEARSLYGRLKNKPPLSLEFFDTMISAEKAQLEPQVKEIRRCHEDAIRYFGATSPDLWLNYMKLVVSDSNGFPGQVGNIYWRALKKLDPELSDEFNMKHTLLFTPVTEETQQLSDDSEIDVQ